MKKLNTRTLAYLSLLTALQIVLSRLASFNVWNMKIGFAFLPIAVAAILFGPASSCAVAVMGDIIGATLLPSGTFFPGFTLTAVGSGLTWGLLLHKKQGTANILGAVLIEQLVWGLLVNSLWLSMLYGTEYLPTMGSRIPQCLILGPMQFLLVKVMTHVLARFRRTAVS